MAPSSLISLYLFIPETPNAAAWIKGAFAIAMGTARKQFPWWYEEK
jgi:hypothetical protein